MSKGETEAVEELMTYLDEGQVTDYVDQRLFKNKIDNLEAHIERKKALAELTRYSILYLLYEYGEVSRKRLSDETNRSGNLLEQPLRTLRGANLIERIPGPEGADNRKTYYRISTLGKQEIASDIRNILGGYADEDRFQILVDPDLVDGLDPDASRLQRFDGLKIDVSPETIQTHQSGLQRRFHEHRRAVTSGD